MEVASLDDLANVGFDYVLDDGLGYPVEIVGLEDGS